MDGQECDTEICARGEIMFVRNIPNGRLVDEAVGNDLLELIYMDDSNQLGCQYHRCVFGDLKGFRRGESLVRSLTNQRVAS